MFVLGLVFLELDPMDFIVVPPFISIYAVMVVRFDVKDSLSFLIESRANSSSRLGTFVCAERGSLCPCEGGICRLCPGCDVSPRMRGGGPSGRGTSGLSGRGHLDGSDWTGSGFSLLLVLEVHSRSRLDSCFGLLILSSGVFVTLRFRVASEVVCCIKKGRFGVFYFGMV